MRRVAIGRTGPADGPLGRRRGQPAARAAALRPGGQARGLPAEMILRYFALPP